MGSRVTMGLVMAAVLLGGASRGGADTRRPHPSPARAGEMAYSVVRMPDGGIRFSGTTSDLTFHKTSYGDGHFAFEITSGRDRVTIQLNAFALVVTRAGRTVSSATNTLTPETLSRVHVMLAGSPAIAQYRRLAGRLAVRHDQSAQAYGVLLGATVIAWLGGDAGAPARFAHDASNRLGVVFRVRRGDCWADYEANLMAAENDMNACFAGAALQSSSFWQWAYATGCSTEYLVRADGYWFGYLSCEAVPLRMQ
jgi:hypothetical protein